MTPFGARLRLIRAEKGITLTRMAEDLGLSAAYLSALEHGRRSPPRPGLVRQICHYFNIIWDEADELHELARQSRAKVALDTAGLSPKATLLANLLSSRIDRLDEATIDRLIAVLSDGVPKR